jgi:adenylosuccinate synthase
MVRAIVGANWGDEGKGKITDLCAEKADIVVRYQGGSNAGHTIINQYGKFALHQLPSGIFHERVWNVISNGVALNADFLLAELELVKKGMGLGADAKVNLLISDRAQLLMGYHIKKDVYEEERLADRKFGSTKSGIAPFYADKYSKVGFQIWQILSDPDFPQKVNNICERTNVDFAHLYRKEPLEPATVLREAKMIGEKIKPYVSDTSTFLRQAIKDGKEILLEGQLGALRDIDHGIYPYVTSSSTLAGYAASGAGIPPGAIKEIIAVSKAYSTCVGEGPFVTELSGSEAQELRNRGGDAGEYGATTGRARRVGFFDLIASRYGCEIQGATSIALTGLDVLGYLDEIPVCIGYELNGKMIAESRTGGECSGYPSVSELYAAKPAYTVLPGWKSDIRGASSESQLPDNAKRYVAFLEERLGAPIAFISTGPKRDEIICR